MPPPSMPVSPSDLPPPPPLSGHEHGERAVVGLAIALGVLGLLWVLLLLQINRLTQRWCWVRKIDEEQRINSKGQKWGKKMIGEASKEQKVTMDVSEWLDKYKLFQIDELREATADFDRSCLIRGSVYRGKINGEMYAVKQMKWNAIAELKILQKVNHTNLVKLEGFCIDAEPCICYLVYEYVPNGSLYSWLHDPTRSGNLDWHHRLRIAVDLANGLQYIHEHTWPCVVHKDIKSSNVLLDARLRAKIANFCLARTGHNAVTTHIVGTQGYVAPEYVAEGLVTTKMDVFAYGVVLLELVTGREAVSMEEGRALWAEAEERLYADGAVKAGKLVGWMDGALAEQSSAVEGAVAVMNIARACLQRDPGRRPGMVDVVYALAKADEASDNYSGEGMSAVGAGNAVIAR
ncbi:Protein LYK5 [Platanthera guangdongensis]|uniref:Protein LYK5 n=1 Tax=Platanthera guangdongensis TaxID=2320717 RepID=A0ABR2MMN2_9ASPA